MVDPEFTIVIQLQVIIGVGVGVGVGVGTGVSVGQVKTLKSSQPFESIILTNIELTSLKGDGTSNKKLGGIDVEPVTK